MKITCEMHPEGQSDERNAFGCFSCSYPTYVAASGVAMVEVRRAPDAHEIWRSEDNGRAWSLSERVPNEEALEDGTWAQWLVGPFYLDPDGGQLLRFEAYSQHRTQPSLNAGYHDHVKSFMPNTYRLFYRISRDGGLNWGEQRQLIEDGAEFDATHWARGVTVGSGAAVAGEVPPYLKRADGRISIPVQRRSPDNQDAWGTIQAGRLNGAWIDDGSDLKWRTGGTVHGGGCEQTVAPLRDGRWLNIMRVQGQIEPYLFDVWQRPYALSEDGGDTWSVPQPLRYDDGGEFTTPRAWSQLIRSDADGCLYWIANILPGGDASEEIRREWPSRADPRYPLSIARIDEAALTVVRDSVTTIVDREPGESKYVRFSNFFAYNDRETGEIALLLMKAYHEDQPDQPNMPHPAWRFRLAPQA